MSDPKWEEVKTTDSKEYYIIASWEGRAETPDELAPRFLRMMDAFAQIDPVFARWTCGAKRRKNFEMIRDRYASEIAAGIELDDWGEPTPVCGYWFGAITRDTPRNRSFAVLCNAGATLKSAFPNHLSFSTSSLADPQPDADVISYRVFRPALLAIVDAWDPVPHGRLFSATDPAQRKRLLFPCSLDLISLPVARRENRAASDGAVRALAQRRTVDDRDHGNLRRGQPRAPQSRARHGRRHGAVERPALAFA